MTPTPKLSMQKQIRKKREQKPRCYHPAFRRTRAAEHLPPTVICVSCIPDGFAGRIRRPAQSRNLSCSLLFAYRRPRHPSLRPIRHSCNSQSCIIPSFSRNVVKARPGAVRRVLVAHLVVFQVADKKPCHGMDFPNGGAPATGQRARESAVIFNIQVHVIDHQLSSDFDLLALQRIYASKRPFWGARVRSHLSNDAGFIHFRGVAEYGLWFILQNLLRQCRVKAQSDVEVIAVRELQFAIRSFPDRGFTVGPFAGVFHEVKKSDDGKDVALAKISQRWSRLRMVTAVQGLWNLALQRLEISSIQERCGSRGRTWDLVLQEIQVRVVPVGRVGAPRWELRVARLRGQACWITAGNCLLFGSHFGQIMSAVSVQAGGNAEQEN